jgi:hypothetical protein
MISVDSFYGPSKLQIPFVKLAGHYVSEKPIYSLTKGKYLSKQGRCDERYYASGIESYRLTLLGR